MTQDTNVQNLIINKLSKAQYERIANPSDTELYLTPDTSLSADDLKTINNTSLVGSGNIALQEIISDLSTIRSGASAGATALQPNDNISELVNNAGYITVSALNGYATENWVGNQGYITSSALNGYATENWVTNQNYFNQNDVENYLNTDYFGSAGYGKDIIETEISYVIPPQSGNNNCFLKTNGVFTSWENINNYIATDNTTISKNLGGSLQAIGVIDQHNTTTAIKTWTGTKAGYDAIVTKDTTTLYVLTDVSKIYFGDTLISNVGNNNLFDFKWADHQLNDIQWLRADTFSWQSGDVYVTAYNHLVQDIQGITSETETIGSYTVTFYRATDGHKICLADQEQTVLNIYNSVGIAWYYILDTTNTQFKLPRTKYGFEGLRGNVGDYIGESLPMPSHTHTRGSMNITGSFGNLRGDGSGYYNASGAFSTKQTTSGTSNNGNNNVTGRQVEFTASNSWTGSTSQPNGLPGVYQNNVPVQERATQMYLYFYVGDYTQSAIEQTAGLNSELFNGKADRDGSNMIASVKNFSGQWVPTDDAIIANVSVNGSTDLSYDLSNWIPKDGYVYEILLTARIQGTTTNNDYCPLYVGTSLTGSNFIPLIIGRQTSTTRLTMGASSIIPLGTDRMLYITRRTNYMTTIEQVVLTSYRRIGTNQ